MKKRRDNTGSSRAQSTKAGATGVGKKTRPLIRLAIKINHAPQSVLRIFKAR